MLKDDHGSAITLLESFLQGLESSEDGLADAYRYAPGLVGLMVSLRAREGSRLLIRRELAKAARHYRRLPNPPPSLLRAAGAALLESSNADDIAATEDIYQKLRQQDPKDRHAIAGYVASRAQSSRVVEPDVSKLTPVARLINGVDVDILENGGVPVRQISTLASTGSKRKGDGSDKPVKKRVRKSRLPKDYDPQKPPDPERWLPLRDRSTYRPKGKKGRQKAAALTQGGMTESKGKETAYGAARAGVVVAEKAVWRY